MSEQQQKGTNWVAVITMMFIYGMISFVTNLSAQMGKVCPIVAGCDGFNAAFLLQSVICLVAAVLTIVMVREKATDAAKADPTGVRRQTLETIMKRDVFTVPDTASVAQAMQLLTSRGISAAPIVDANAHVVGMISDGDIIRAMAKRGRSYMDPIAMIINSEKLDPDFSHKLDEVMNSPVTAFATMNVISVDVHDSFDEVCRVCWARTTCAKPRCSMAANWWAW